MRNDFDKILQDILKTHTETPPAECWDKLLSRLETPPAPETETPSVSTPDNASVFSQFAGSVVGKIVAVVTAAAVVGGVALIVLLSDTTSPADESEQKTAFVEIQDSISLKEDTIRMQSESNLQEQERKIRNEETSVAFFTETDTLPLMRTDSSVKHSVIDPLQTLAKKEEAKQETPVKKNQSQTQETEKESIVTVVKPVPAQPLSKEEPQESETNPKQPELKIPNIFTPNGDYVNDYFVISGIEQLSENQLIVYHRNGRIVYDKMNYQNDWNAENIEDGVYYYIFKFIYQNTQFMRSGSLTIKR